MSARILYSYYRSSAAYRVRIALNLKNLDYEYKSVAGLRQGDKKFAEEFRKLNPQQLVPILIDNNQVLAQSIAIIEYLEEVYPTPSLLPIDPTKRAYVRQIALLIACDIHPLNIMRVRKYLTHPFGHSKNEKLQWYQHWTTLGFTALERLLQTYAYSGKCCLGDEPSLADICLIPQVYNMHRFGLSMDKYPTLKRINDYCIKLPAFLKAKPELQPDIREYNSQDEY